VSNLSRALGAAAITLTFAFTQAVTATAADVTVWDSSKSAAAKCPEIDDSNPRKAKGGCVARAKTGSPIQVLVRSMVGDLVFGKCVYPHALRIDAAGRTALDIGKVDGPRPCNDIRPCWSKEPTPFDNQPFLTWNGQLRTDANGVLHNDVDVCLETCMGRFTGTVDMRMERTADRARATISNELLGMTGMELDGYWNVELPGIEIRSGSDQEAPAVDESSSGLSALLSAGRYAAETPIIAMLSGFAGPDVDRRRFVQSVETGP
jgi:hypothetical protein